MYNLAYAACANNLFAYELLPAIPFFFMAHPTLSVKYFVKRGIKDIQETFVSYNDYLHQQEVEWRISSGLKKAMFIIGLSAPLHRKT